MADNRYGIGNGAAGVLKARLRVDLRAAMKARAGGDAAVIRTLIAAIDNAEAPALAPDPSADLHRSGMIAGHSFAAGTAEVPRLPLSATQLRDILASEAAARDKLAQQMTELGQPGRAGAAAAEARIVRRYIDD